LTAEWDIGNAAPSVWYGLVKETNTADADCVLLACTGVRTAPIIERLEAEMGKPLVSATAVTIWRALRLAGYVSPVANRGILLKRF
jgi:maleate isomerase